METFIQSSFQFMDLVNDAFQDVPPINIILLTILSSFFTAFLYIQFTYKVSLIKRLKTYCLKWMKKLPNVKEQIKAESAKVRKGFSEEMQAPTSQLSDMIHLPKNGLNDQEVLELTENYLGCGKYNWKEGTLSGTVYNGNDELTELMTKVYGMAAWTNPLHPDAFPGVRKMEAEIVRMCCNLFNGSSSSCGTVTGGGTESIVLACKAYRDYARDIKGIENPNMVVPFTAHAAFDKAADLMNIDLIHAPVDPKTKRVDVKKMEKLINGSTCLLAGSAPQFPHGSIDDIEGIAALGLKYDIPVHVDACLGGFLICFMKEAGFPLKPFDFSVNGVTSISADTHKYGYAPKGSSVILYSKLEYRQYQWFTFPEWPGGIYATATIAGSRPGGIIAACWAALVSYGYNGYVDATKRIIQTTQFIAKELNKIEEIEIIGEPDVSVVAFGSDYFNIYGLSNGLKERGWNLNVLQFPSCIHLCVTLLQTQPGVAERFVNDVKELTKKLMTSSESAGLPTNPKERLRARALKKEPEGAAIYGMAQSLPDRSMVDLMTRAYLDSMYSTKADNYTESSYL